ncbi:MAG: type II toxin-antitoxin system RelE/ParE family toxin [Candidatus Acidiferrales bacterium]
MATVRWTVGVQQDLQDIVEYIGRDSHLYAAATADRIFRAVRRLARHPRLGRMAPEYRDPSVRELILSPYRVVYRVLRSRVGVIAIVHGNRDLLARLRNADWTV